MAETQIVGRTGTISIVSDSFAPFGERIVGLPEPADDPGRWHPKMLSQSDLKKRYGASDEELLELWPLSCGFPKPTRTATRTFVASWRVEQIREWSTEKIDEWEAGIRKVSARLPKR